jgi:hypothetical protein
MGFLTAISVSSKQKWWIGAAIFAGCILLWNPLHHVVFSVRLARSLQKVSAGDDGRNLAVVQVKALRQWNGRRYEALTYRPMQTFPEKAIILAPGISELGCYHPRLVALSRFLADRGFLVIAPDIQEFRHFQVSAAPIDQLLFWHDRVPTLEGGEKI